MKGNWTMKPLGSLQDVTINDTVHLQPQLDDSQPKPLKNARADRVNKVWADAVERAQDRLLVFGTEALPDDELLSVLLAGPIGRDAVVAVVQLLIQKYSNLVAVVNAPSRSLMKIEGMNRAGIAQLRGIRAAAIRLSAARMVTRPLIKNREQLLRVCNIAFGHLTRETCCILYLDKSTRLISYDLTRNGTVDHVTAYPREIIGQAIDVGAVNIYLIHNHPSGDPVPSPLDVRLTHIIYVACQLLGITLLDHLIVAGGRHVSLADIGLLRP